MKDFFIVLKYEFVTILKNKGFIVSTIILSLLLAIGLSIPTIKDSFFSLGESAEEIAKNTQSEQIFGYVNQENALANVEDLKASFVLGELKEFGSQEKLEESVESGEIEAGYVIQSPTKYQYIVENNEMTDQNNIVFEEALATAYRRNGFTERGISYEEVNHLISPMIKSDAKILGKDSAENYLYTYILVFAIYFIIIIYGQIIATSVASEKSNRAMEVLVTSTDSKNLIFGKVLGVSLASILQFAFILMLAMLSYHLNASAWDNRLDFIFKIPSEVLLTFSVFGILGYFFYAFIFGALGALVSRTEDVSTSSTPITIIFIAVFMVAMLGMYNTEGMLLKGTSFIPFSSFMSMFVRVSMGSVSILEVIVSLTILLISTILVGIFASKIYRMGTLRYGNPIKLRNAFKLLRKK